MMRRSNRSLYKVCIVGGAGGIGQPLGLLAAQNTRVTDLALLDVEKRAVGVAVDLDHMDVRCRVTGYAANDKEAALEGCSIVLIPAGVPRQPGMTRQDLFDKNAGIVAQVAFDISQFCPDAMVGIIANPVNATVPVAAAVMKKQGTYNANKVMGITSLDVVRANKFISDMMLTEPKHISVNVVGGHSGPTIVPLLSTLEHHGMKFTPAERDAMVHRIQFGGDEVVKAKAEGGGGSATLSMAHAANVWLTNVTEGLDGIEPAEICAYVETDLERTPFFALPLQIGTEGIERVYPVPNMDSFENELYGKAVVELQKNIDEGLAFAAKWVPPSVPKA